MGKLYDLLSSLIEKVNSTVKVSAQTLTDEQKTQARANIGAGTSDVKTWSNIEDKPFGDFPTGGDTLTWDGNTEGLEIYSEIFVKISDAVPTKTDLAQGYSYSICWGATNMNTTVYDDTYITTDTDGVLQLGTGDNGLFLVTWMICPSDVDIEDGIILKKGTYAMFVSSGDVAIYTASLTIPGYTGFPVTKKIEEKYLPDRGPIYLYADAEYYLYATEDTSDINKRVTCQQFESFIDSGRLVMLKYVDSNGGIDCFCPLMLNISSNGVGEFVSSAGPKFHTAEYVAE